MTENRKPAIAIIGGGTAGWMAAMVFAHTWQQDIDITLVESDAIGTVGVGEGSTPALKNFFDQLGISEREWMPACNATYKCGITFSGWSTKPGFEHYYHPFASQLDHFTLPMFIRQAQERVQGLNVDAHPDRYFLSAYLAQHHLAPKPGENFPFELQYGYHFDASLLGQFLQQRACRMGVTHRRATVVAVNRANDGNIASLGLDTSERVEADIFVDCTGFAGLLIQQHLGTPFVSYQRQLSNNAAVAIASPLDSAIGNDGSAPALPSQTLSTAMACGWAWKIPLTNRFGNGYVYSRDYCSADQAEFELRQRLGLLNADVDARHLTMKVGRVEEHWRGNCLAVGLSQGFIEPLEATALFLVQQTVSLFAESFTRGDYSSRYRHHFNQRINRQFDGVRDYIVTHYKTNSRDDTAYWRDARANPDDISDPLRALYRCWMAGGDLAAEVRRQQMDEFYPVASWYCILAGMGIFPSSERLHRPAPADRQRELGRIDDFIRRCALNYRDHRQQLAELSRGT